MKNQNKYPPQCKMCMLDKMGKHAEESDFYFKAYLEEYIKGCKKISCEHYKERPNENIK